MHVFLCSCIHCACKHTRHSEEWVHCFPLWRKQERESCHWLGSMFCVDTTAQLTDRLNSLACMEHRLSLTSTFSSLTKHTLSRRLCHAVFLNTLKVSIYALPDHSGISQGLPSKQKIKYIAFDRAQAGRCFIGCAM